MTARVIDFHTHAFPEKVAGRAVKALTETYQVSPVAEATVNSLVRVMDEAGVGLAVVVPVATRPDQVRSINEWAARLQSERIVCFGALHPDVSDLAGEVEKIVALGLRGVKLQPNFQEFSPDDPALFPAYEAAAGRLIALFHSGQEIKPFDRVYARPAALARVHQRFPDLRMVVAHMGGYQMWDEVRSHLVGRDVYFDSSYCGEDGLSDDDFVQLARAHGVERVLFGTDFPWSHPRKDLERLRSTDLTPAELEAIEWRNAAALLHLDLHGRT
jgi:predicted TIM-barrel fold metal-dependent hydrolase